MKRVLITSILIALSYARAGDWIGSTLDALGGFYPTTTYVDYSRPRWELSECEKLGAFLGGKYGIQDTQNIRVDTFVGSISEAQFWKNTGRFKREIVDFGLGKAKMHLVKAEKRPYPFQELADDKNFKGIRFFVGLANVPNKPVLCSVVFYE